MKKNLLGYTMTQMEQLAVAMNQKPFKGRQLFRWIYRDNLSDFAGMTNLSLAFRDDLGQTYRIENISLLERKESSDGTEKFLFKLHDGKLIESVLIPDGDKKTACISSQAGCALGCKYCATGQLGFGRNLGIGEIVGQLLHLRSLYDPETIHNIVFMGMGEPLMNYENVMEAITIISSVWGLSLSVKRITVSTAGIVPRIYDLADSGVKVNLAVSLNAPTSSKRLKLMPIEKKYKLEKLMESLRYYTRTTGKRMTFEYILFAGLNDSENDARDLAKIIRGISCKINLLAYNPIDGLGYKRPSEDDINRFAKILYPIAPAVTVRKSRGTDIEAACGQLAGKKISYRKGPRS